MDYKPHLLKTSVSWFLICSKIMEHDTNLFNRSMVLQTRVKHPARQLFNGGLIQIANAQSKPGAQSCKSFPPCHAFIPRQDKLNNRAAHKRQGIFLYRE